ncbi:type VI secretion system baseplate subunit TssK [Noviherbaspirillum galbum]|uniref:Type VI secretion system baseplate subunit TssK n=1 Tax=Noviherbaspirillum galbum TaxID=2709383 RepID=A0A6B3SZW7_9BURK|nr:type VI secretion system baseplate subunit TssK [Noviherbaspirillum galbum]NEX64809.1 type VI secretion system baseplate subunit TssK [Noviherbaspirillum galbum]
MTSLRLTDRIQWHEGMLLTPQHFQQEGARVDALIAWQSLATQPYGWGVRNLSIDESLLTTGLLRILSIDAILPNGMAASFDVEQSAGRSLELDLSAWAADMETGDVSVYLVVGRTRSQRVPGQPAMFCGTEGAMVEDEVSEAMAADIPRMAVNLSLAAGPAPAAAYVSLRLMTVRKDNEIVRRGEALPPMLEVPLSSSLRQRAQTLASHMRSKAVFLARQTASPSSRLEDRLTILEQKTRLSSLILQLPVLEAVLRCPVVQPVPLFLALCAQLGPLATLRPGAVPILPPAYDHADPAPAFDAVLNALSELVDEVSQEWKTSTFGFDGQAFSLTMQPDWVGARLVIGLRGHAERELAQWMAGAVIGSKTVWTSLTDRRVLGAARRRIDDAPELGLRSSAGYTLFSIEVSEQFIVADQPLMISNANESTLAQRPHEVVLFIKG